MVVDSSGNAQANVAVKVLDPSTSSTVGGTTTDTQGSFSLAVASGTYNLQFIPPGTNQGCPANATSSMAERAVGLPGCGMNIAVPKP
jgi:hypothetical protein